MQPAKPGVRRRSPWFYVAIGGGGLLTVAALLAGAFLLLLGQATKVRDTNANPETRLAEAKRLLGARQLPEGYRALVAVSLSDVTGSVALSREPPDARGVVPGGVQHGFFYHRMPGPPHGTQPIMDYLQGHDPAPGSQVSPILKLWVDEVLARGTLTLPGYALRYVAQRGRYQLGSSYAPTQGLSVYIVFECPRHNDHRTGIWFTPDPAPDAPAGAPALAGTPADEEAVRAFVSHFNPCQER
jgi:hypothetical protein